MRERDQREIRNKIARIWLDIRTLERNMAVDFSKLNGAIAQLSGDTDKLIASLATLDATLQTSVDAATASVTAEDTKVVAATPAG